LQKSKKNKRGKVREKHTLQNALARLEARARKKTLSTRRDKEWPKGQSDPSRTELWPQTAENGERNGTVLFPKKRRRKESGKVRENTLKTRPSPKVPPQNGQDERSGRREAAPPNGERDAFFVSCWPIGSIRSTSKAPKTHDSKTPKK
jgi:hypothetical protein